MEETFTWVEMVVHPSLDMMDKMVKGGKVTGGVSAGSRVVHMVLEASSGEELGKTLRSFPIWGALDWTVTPLQSFGSAIEQDKAAFKTARAMGASHR
ncbi:MAG: hypothetical protein L3K02_02120 [Thermoplasmata archaeon]|nr:hypothetical protein [Thermoplasmata archaeon]